MPRAIRTTSCFLLLAMIVSLNAHLPFMQVVAWSTMLVQYARDASIREAAEKTFSGDHPCGMCQVIEQARDESAGARHDPGSISSREQADFRGLAVSRSGFINNIIRDFLTDPATSPVPLTRRFPPPVPPPISLPG